jgi:two-component system, cell cycle sensor histidine kinase and response regulator CckA
MPTILLIEDDGAVRRVLRHMLHNQGHKVIEAGNAPEAIQAAAGCQGLIDLVITDVVMPRSNCDGLIAQLQQARPEMKAVLISGYPEEMLNQHGVDARSRPDFLQKPFTSEQLQAKVREVMGAEKAHRQGA